MAGASGITHTTNGVVRNYSVAGGQAGRTISSTGYLVEYSAAGGLTAAVYIPNTVGVYPCGSSTSAHITNAYFQNSGAAWLGFTGTAFGGTPLAALGGSCTVEVLSIFPKLEGRFVAQLVGAAAGNGRLTSGFFSVPNDIGPIATVGTGTGSFALTPRVAGSLAAAHVGTINFTQVGVEIDATLSSCVLTARGTKAGSAQTYSLQISIARGGGQAGGFELKSADGSLSLVGGSQVASKSISFNRTARTVQVGDSFGNSFSTATSTTQANVNGILNYTVTGLRIPGC